MRVFPLQSRSSEWTVNHDGSYPAIASVSFQLEAGGVHCNMKEGGRVKRKPYQNQVLADAGCQAWMKNPVGCGTVSQDVHQQESDFPEQLPCSFALNGKSFAVLCECFPALLPKVTPWWRGTGSLVSGLLRPVIPSCRTCLFMAFS